MTVVTNHAAVSFPYDIDGVLALVVLWMPEQRLGSAPEPVVFVRSNGLKARVPSRRLPASGEHALWLAVAFQNVFIVIG